MEKILEDTGRFEVRINEEFRAHVTSTPFCAKPPRTMPALRISLPAT
jgi:hypothetical protein